MRNVKSVSMQVSGFTLVFDVRRAAGSRLVSALLDCGDCPGGREPLRQGRTYRVVMTEYLAGGGDSFSMIAQNKVDSTASSGGSPHDRLSVFCLQVSVSVLLCRCASCRAPWTRTSCRTSWRRGPRSLPGCRAESPSKQRPPHPPPPPPPPLRIFCCSFSQLPAVQSTFKPYSSQYY